MKSFGVFFVMSLKKKDIIKQYEISPDELEEQVALALADFPEIEMAEQYEESIKEFEPEKIVSGRVISIANDNVIVDIGCKSEGEVPLSEFDVPPVAGEKIEVFLETMEDEHGEIILSKKKADRIRGWTTYHHKKGDVGKASGSQIKWTLIGRWSSCFLTSLSNRYSSHW